ncbi:hypothetical protein GE21DRAFT_1213888 [Neurospora crassa]|nr:hypothetical protein GE21DRAFT_1213888 [Neurospora crassa]
MPKKNLDIKQDAGRSVTLESKPVLWNAGKIVLGSIEEPPLTGQTYVQEYAASCAYCRALKEG